MQEAVTPPKPNRIFFSCVLWKAGLLPRIAYLLRVATIAFPQIILRGSFEDPSTILRRSYTHRFFILYWRFCHIFRFTARKRSSSTCQFLQIQIACFSLLTCPLDTLSYWEGNARVRAIQSAYAIERHRFVHAKTKPERSCTVSMHLH